MKKDFAMKHNTIVGIASRAESKSQCDPEHYKAGSIETIDVLEDFVSIENRKLTPRQKYDVSQALKYLLRVGLKGPSEVDLQKAENYIHRALTGEWIDPEFLVVK